MMWRLALLASLAAVAATGQSLACLQHAAKKIVVSETVQLLHGLTFQAFSKCKKVHQDVYQRFSGYVARHRLAQFCEGILGILENLQETAIAGICDHEETRLDPQSLVSRLQAITAELRSMLADLNAFGDGSLAEGVEQHVDALAAQLGKVPRGSELPQACVGAADTLVQLLNFIFEQVSESATYNVARLGVGGAHDSQSGLPRFLSALDGFPASVGLDMIRAAPQCHGLHELYRSHHVFDPVSDPAAWRSRDVSGFEVPVPPPQKLLFTISQVLPLAYSLIAVMPRSQSGAQELTSEYKSMFADTGGLSAPTSDWLAKAVAEPSCGGKGLAYSPGHCLVNEGWGSMMFSLSTEPPFDGVLAVSEMTQRDPAKRPQPFVQPVANHTSSLDALVDAADRVYKSLNTPSPDVFFLSPMVGNCLTLRRLGPSRGNKAAPGAVPIEAPPQLTPKLIWVPVNPLIAPPFEVVPNFTAWHSQWLQAVESKASSGPTAAETGTVETDGEAIWWLAQCSLASASAIMEEQGYALLHLEHTFAVFVLKAAWTAVSKLLRPISVPASTAGPLGEVGSSGLRSVEPGAVSLYDHWLKGWHCSAATPGLFGLKTVRGAAELAALQNRSLPAKMQRDALCQFISTHRLPLVEWNTICDKAEAPLPQPWRSWELQDPLDEPGKAYILKSSARGRCLSHLGFCECFPPYRGRFCENVEPGKKDGSRKYRAVLHYLVGDREKLLADFERTLPILWERFNNQEDYPVVVFHDGMSKASRKRILEASSNRIWFAYVDDYKSVPAVLKGRIELDLGGYGLGYRGMCRFRSGPIFMQPVMKGFDYAWTLDTDGYFPTDILSDPLERMWREDRVYGYSHVSRDQASAVQHFWEFCRLYFESKGIDPKSTKMMRRLTDALVLRDTYWHEWNRVLFMNDIEITKLSWFQSRQYQDFFEFLDSVGGFWLYRWGDHAVRTIAVALFLNPDHLMRMRVPYGHQNTCRCGDDRPHEVCVRASSSDWWRCIHESEIAAVPPGTIVASGEVETVKEEILFGGT